MSDVLFAGPIIASAFLPDATFDMVDAWLANGDTTLGSILHIATGLINEGLSVMQAPLTSMGGSSNLNQHFANATSFLRISPEVAEIMNTITETFRMPNIEGIVIFTENEQVTRQMDISEQALVVQQDFMSTTYATDSAVPHPREWSLKGYLSTTLPTDHFLIIKPSLLLQRNYLDTCMRTRRPVWFKTFDNEFVQVLIASMTCNWDPKSLNTMGISIQLKEYVPLKVFQSPEVSKIANAIRKFVRG